MGTDDVTLHSSPCDDVSLVFPSESWVTVFEDNFTRADGAIGAQYELLFGADGTDAHGSTQIVSNALKSIITPFAGGANPLLMGRITNATLSPTILRQRVSITLGAFSGGNPSSIAVTLYLHAPDSDSGFDGFEWIHNYQTGIETLDCFTFSDGGNVSSPSLSPGDIISLENAASGNLILRVNGIQVTSCTGANLQLGTALLQLAASGFTDASIIVDSFKVEVWE